MASRESKLFYFFLKIIKKKKFLELQFAFGKFDFYNSKEPPKKSTKSVMWKNARWMDEMFLR
jgi:hypothetical protein